LKENVDAEHDDRYDADNSKNAHEEDSDLYLPGAQSAGCDYRYTVAIWNNSSVGRTIKFAGRDRCPGRKGPQCVFLAAVSRTYEHRMSAAVKRFQEWIKEARGDLSAWASTPETCVPLVAARCEPPDITDLLEALDHLAEEKAALPEWDGDSHDGIGKAQELFARILAALPGELQPLVSEGLERRAPETRAWVRLALDRNGGASP
jgi:hypothetical protein